MRDKRLNNIEEIRRLIQEADSIMNAAKAFYKNEYNFAAYRRFRFQVLRLKLDRSHHRPYAEQPYKKRTPLSEVLTENSSFNPYHLKKRLLKEGLLVEQCLVCGIGPEWQGRPLSLQLDHINGIKEDNRIENLRIICPNCHSQTVTYASRNKGRHPAG